MHGANQLNISNLFYSSSRSTAHHPSFLTPDIVMKIRRGHCQQGVKYERGMKSLQCFTNIWLYLRDNAKYKRSYSRNSRTL